MLTLQSYLTLGAIIFSIGVIGIVINRKNIIIIMMCTELLLIAVNFNFIAFSYFNQDLAGQIFVFFILTVAAAEAAAHLRADAKERCSAQQPPQQAASSTHSSSSSSRTASNLLKVR